MFLNGNILIPCWSSVKEDRNFECDGGVMVSIVAFQAVDPGSIPGHRM